MANKNLKDELRKLDEEEAKIRQQRERLKDEAKAQALAAANAAVDELNSLGYRYRLVEEKSQASVRTTSHSPGTRRSGIRDNVLRVIVDAGARGIAPAAIREKLGIEGKSGAQSVANALSALKRTGKISDKDGAYVPH